MVDGMKPCTPLLIASMKPFAAQPPVRCNLFFVKFLMFEYFLPELTTSIFKDLNFGNQLVRFVKSKDFSNYFGKVSNIVYEKSMLELSIIGFTNYHLNESYLNLNSNVDLEDFSAIRFANLENVLSNYFKITLNNIDDNNILDLNSNSNGIVDSNALITQVLLNCALSLSFSICIAAKEALWASNACSLVCTAVSNLALFSFKIAIRSCVSL